MWSLVYTELNEFLHNTHVVVLLSQCRVHDIFADHVLDQNINRGMLITKI